MKRGESAYTVYASSRPFECGEIGHKRMAWPRREKDGKATEESSAAGRSCNEDQESRGPTMGEEEASEHLVMGDNQRGDDQGDQVEMLEEDGGD